MSWVPRSRLPAELGLYSLVHAPHTQGVRSPTIPIRGAVVKRVDGLTEPLAYHWPGDGGFR